MDDLGKSVLELIKQKREEARLRREDVEKNGMCNMNRERTIYVPSTGWGEPEPKTMYYCLALGKDKLANIPCSKQYMKKCKEYKLYVKQTYKLFKNQ